MSEQAFASAIRRAVAVNDQAIAEAIGDAELGDVYDVTELPEDPDEDEEYTTEVQLHEDLVARVEAAAEREARDLYREYGGDD